MDPQACLDEADSAIDERDFETARDRIHDYQRWRSKGGFEPEGGDARLESLIQKFLNTLLPGSAPGPEEEASSLCWKCNGSGEGPADGTSCPECRGTGEEE